MGLGARCLMAFDSTQAMMIWGLSEGQCYFEDIQKVVLPVFK